MTCALTSVGNRGLRGYVRVSGHMLIEKPRYWSWELAAAIPEVRLFHHLAYESQGRFSRDANAKISHNI